MNGGPTGAAAQTSLVTETGVRPANLATDVLAAMRDNLSDYSFKTDEGQVYRDAAALAGSLRNLVNPDAVLPQLAASEVKEILKDLALHSARGGEYVPQQQLQRSLDLLGIATYINSLK